MNNEQSTSSIAQLEEEKMMQERMRMLDDRGIGYQLRDVVIREADGTERTIKELAITKVPVVEQLISAYMSGVREAPNKEIKRILRDFNYEKENALDEKSCKTCLGPLYRKYVNKLKEAIGATDELKKYEDELKTGFYTAHKEGRNRDQTSNNSGISSMAGLGGEGTKRVSFFKKMLWRASKRIAKIYRACTE